MNLLSEIIVTG